MSKKLWEASEFIKKTSNLSNYEKFIQKNYNYKSYQNYSKLLSWSLKNTKRFWNSIWDYTKVNGIKNENKAIAHIAVVITLIAILGNVTKPLMSAIEAGRSVGIFRVCLMIFTSTLAMITFIRSFIKARKNN